jgi:hypothetical protein
MVFWRAKIKYTINNNPQFLRVVFLTLTLVLLLSFPALAVTVDDIVKDNSTPEAVCDWISGEIEYKTNVETWGMSNYWQTPEETLRVQSADCKGYAVLVYECLKKMNLEDVKMVALTNNHSGHVVVIFKQNGRWQVVSNGKLYDYTVENYKDLFKLFIGYSNYQFCTPNSHNILIA